MNEHDGRGLDPTTRATIEEIAAAAAAHDGQDPLDEGTRLAIEHRDETELTAWVCDDGFALLVDDDLTLVVRPEARRSGLGVRLLGHLLEVLYDDEPLNAWAHGDHPGAAGIAAAGGLFRARDLWVMRRPGDLPLPDVEPPAGVAVRPYRPEDAEEVVRINAAAFAGHPEQSAMDADNLAQRMALPWFDPAGLLIAEDATGILGFHWTKVHPDGSGEVYVVAVDPAAQGRGLGTVLTVAGLRHLVERGAPEIHLYVESDNEAAIALYSRLGFTHDALDTHVQYRRFAVG